MQQGESSHYKQVMWAGSHVSTLLAATWMASFTLNHLSGLGACKILTSVRIKVFALGHVAMVAKMHGL